MGPLRYFRNDFKVQLQETRVKRICSKIEIFKTPTGIFTKHFGESINTYLHLCVYYVKNGNNFRDL